MRAMLGDAARLPAWSHQLRKARSSATDGATIRSTSKPRSTASGSSATVVNGAAPTTAAYDCRPYLTGNNETCTFAAPQAGTWHVTVRGYSAYSGVSLRGSYSGN